MTRWLRRLVLCVGLAAAAVAADRVLAQPAFDRPGEDYTSFTVRSGDPAMCAARCDRDGRCRAWSFVYPSPGGAPATCHLKNRVPQRVENPCCVSGVKGAGVVEPRSGAVEFSIDRVGGDLRHFDTAADPSGKACADACTADAKCRAWTYVRPGYQGTAARCYLKARVTPPRRKPCCVSGVVR